MVQTDENTYNISSMHSKRGQAYKDRHINFKQNAMGSCQFSNNKALHCGVASNRNVILLQAVIKIRPFSFCFLKFELRKLVYLDMVSVSTNKREAGSTSGGAASKKSNNDVTWIFSDVWTEDYASSFVKASHSAFNQKCENGCSHPEFY